VKECGHLPHRRRSTGQRLGPAEPLKACGSTACSPARPTRRAPDAAVHKPLRDSYEKVRNVAAMQRQNELFESSAAVRSANCSRPSSTTRPAGLARRPGQRKGKPNENLGRELMSVHTGIGNYTEDTLRRRPAP